MRSSEERARDGVRGCYCEDCSFTIRGVAAEIRAAVKEAVRECESAVVSSTSYERGDPEYPVQSALSAIRAAFPDCFEEE